MTPKQRRTRATLYPHKVQTRYDDELHAVIAALADPADPPGVRNREAVRYLYRLALSHPGCPPALRAVDQVHRQTTAPAAHHASPYQAPAPNPPQQPGTAPLDALAVFDQLAPAAPAAPGHRRPKLDRLGRPVTVQTRPLTDAELQQEGARVAALATAEATGQPLPPFELMPWERIVYEDE